LPVDILGRSILYEWREGVYASKYTTRQLNSIRLKTGNIVENNFLLLFQNTDNKPHTYKIEIVGEYTGIR